MTLNDVKRSFKWNLKPIGKVIMLKSKVVMLSFKLQNERLKVYWLERHHTNYLESHDELLVAIVR